MPWLENRLIARAERDTGENADYLRDLLKSSRAAFWKFGLFTFASNHRRHAQADAFHVARLAAVRAQDCGPCLQTVARFALADMPAERVRQILDAPETLPAPLALVHAYADAVAHNTPEANPLRERLEAQIGKKALSELALAVATTPVYATLKRGLGYAQSCASTEMILQAAE